jgi:hypothetical protein
MIEKYSSSFNQSSAIFRFLRESSAQETQDLGS